MVWDSVARARIGGIRVFVERLIGHLAYVLFTELSDQGLGKVYAVRNSCRPG